MLANVTLLKCQNLTCFTGSCQQNSPPPLPPNFKQQPKPKGYHTVKYKYITDFKLSQYITVSVHVWPWQQYCFTSSFLHCQLLYTCVNIQNGILLDCLVISETKWNKYNWMKWQSATIRCKWIFTFKWQYCVASGIRLTPDGKSA